MASISITCPNCAKVLRPKVRPAEGKRVKCPACSEVFLPEMEEEAASVGIQEKPRSKSKAASNGKFQAGQAAPPRKNSPGNGPPSKRRQDDEVEDDLPKSKKKKKAKQKSNTMLYVIGGGAAGGVVLLSLALCAVGAFVWPGFMLSKTENKQVADKGEKTKKEKAAEGGPKGNNDPIGNRFDMTAFVAPDANLLVGGTPSQARSKLTALEQMIRQQPLNTRKSKETAPEMENVYLNSERLLLFGNSSTMDRTATMIAQLPAADMEKLKSSRLLNPAQTIEGHANIRAATPEGDRKGMPRYVVFLNDQNVLISDLDQRGLIDTLNRGKKPAQPNPALDLSRTVDQSMLWVVMTIDANTRQKMKAELRQPGLTSKSLIDAIAAIDNTTSFTLAGDATDAQEVKVTANVNCTNANDAGKIKMGVEEALKKTRDDMGMARTLITQSKQFMKPDQFNNAMESLDLISELLNGTGLSVQGTTATATMKVRSKVLGDLARIGAEAQKKQVIGPLGPPPQFPPPNQDFPNPKGFPQGGPAKTQTYTVNNLPMNQNDVRVFTFQQGKQVTITAKSQVDNPATDVDLYVSRANGKLSIAQDLSVGPDSIVRFRVPLSGAYQIRIFNRGPGNATSTVVTIIEQ